MKTIRIPRRRPFTREAILLAVLLSPGAGGLFAGPTSSSANFTLLPGETGAGGGRVTGATVTADISIGETVAGGVSNVTTGGAQTKGGFTGQLYDTQSLAVSADPAAVEEHETTQLTAVATMDDDSLVNVGGADALWAILDGPIDTIDGNGVATAGDVFINSPANVRGTYDGVDGDLQIMVLNVNAAPPTDPQPDPGFTEQNFDPGQAGLYQGLLTDSGGNVLGAIVGLRIKNTGAFSGKVFFNGKAYALKGVLDGNGDFTGQVIRKGLTPLDVVLHIGETTSGGLSLQGTVDGDSTSGGAIADRAPYHPKNNPAPPELVNKYTFLIPATETGNSAVPGGDGYGAVTVSTSGSIVATGKTGDGVKFGTKGFLTEDGQWHLFQPLFKGQGQLAGVVNFRDQPGVSDFDADLRWVKNPNPKDKLYPGGFDLPPALVGSVFDPPAKGERALDELQDQFYNALLSLAGNTLEDGGFSQVVSWLNSNAIAYYGPEKLGAKASPKNGLLGGSYYDPFTKTKIGFGGAVLQKQGIAGGNFVFANESGYLLIEPGTVFPYPGSEDPGLLDLTEVPNDPVSSPAIEEVPVFDPAAAGLFGGTVHETTGGMNLAGGIENVKLAANGAISGTVWIDGLRYAFKGLVGNDTHVLIDIPRKGLTPVTLALTLDKHIGIADGFVLHGTATVDGTDFDVEAQRRPVYPKGSAPDEHAGAYTIALRAPDGTDPAAEPAGDGYGSLSVLANGICKGLLILADGTKASMAGHVSRIGDWAVYRSLYGNKGYLAGNIRFRDTAGVADLDGACRWLKQNAVPKTKNYLTGFDVNRALIGGAYTVPAKGVNAFAALDDVFYNAWLRLAGPDLAPTTAFDITMLDRAVTWNNANKILYYGPDKTAVKFNPKTGVATGSYLDKSTGANVKFGGALMQEQALLTGSYLSGDQSGIFTISPRQN